MRKPNRISVWAGTVFLLLLPVFVIPLSTGYVQPPAHRLDAMVVGKGNNPKPFVRVDIAGKRSLTVSTDDSGMFSVLLPQGTYSLRVTERSRTMVFTVELFRNEHRTIKLKWW